jgi:hypothetical protein
MEKVGKMKEEIQAKDPQTRDGKGREDKRGDPGGKDGDAKSPPEKDGGNEKDLLAGGGRNEENSPDEREGDAGNQPATSRYSEAPWRGVGARR